MIRALTKGPFTGRHITVIIVAFFAVVIAVNLVMARAAISTFGGVVVENSYVASQNYNKWLDEAAKEKALGWSAKASRLADGRVSVVLSGAPAAGLTVSAVARHPLGRLPDQALTFQRQSDGSFASVQPLAAGRWILRLEAQGGGKRWREEQDLR
ncbi:MAG: FixH family protein [Sphingomonadaceae bacterium]